MLNFASEVARLDGATLERTRPLAKRWLS